MSVEKRIHGTEMEWAAEFDHTPERAEELITEQIPAVKVMEWIRAYIASDSSGDLTTCNPQGIQHMSNGARLYQDVGEHVEYATQEDDSFEGTAANETAGAEIIHDAIAEGIRNDHPGVSEKDLPKFRLHKRVIDSDPDRHVWGYHESYCVDRDAVTEPLGNGEFKLSQEKLRTIGGHYVARGIFFGAGALLPSGEYVIAQKASQASEEFSTGTTNATKPVVNLRDEPHADKEKYRRVHGILGDPNMSPRATRMRTTTTSLVFRLMEHGIYLPHLHLEDLKESAITVAYDPSLKKNLTLKNGKTITALALEREYAEAALSLGRDHSIELPAEEQFAAEEWLKDCDKTAEDPNWLLRFSDWALKLHRMKAYARKHNLSFKDDFNILSGVDCEWDRIDTNPDHKNIARVLEESIWADWMPSRALIEERKTRPPATTRAAVRGRFIRECHDATNSSADWQYVSYMGRTHWLKEPHATSDPDIEKIIVRHQADRSAEPIAKAS
jgi:proteasome accessory factor A